MAEEAKKPTPEEIAAAEKAKADAAAKAQAEAVLAPHEKNAKVYFANYKDKTSMIVTKDGMSFHDNAMGISCAHNHSRGQKPRLNQGEQAMMVYRAAKDAQGVITYTQI